MVVTSRLLYCYGHHHAPVQLPGGLAIAFNGIPSMPFAIVTTDGTAVPIDSSQVDAVSLSNGTFMPKADGTANFSNLPAATYKIIVAGTDLGATPADVARAETDGSVFVFADELSEGFAFTVLVGGGTNLPVNIESDFSQYTLGTCC